MKVRYKIKIETGPKARDLDERQAEVIRELLQWARQYRAEPGKVRQCHDRLWPTIPQALAATTGPGGLVPVAFLGRTSS